MSEPATGSVSAGPAAAARRPHVARGPGDAAVPAEPPGDGGPGDARARGRGDARRASSGNSRPLPTATRSRIGRRSRERTPSRRAADYPFGTDLLGRDMLARTLVGGCVSLGVGLAAAVISILIGTWWGVTSGYAGRSLDTVMMRIVDVLYGLPYILLVILLWVAVADQSLQVRMVVLLLAIGGVSWLTMARVVRGQVLALREAEFVQAARALGSRPGADHRQGTRCRTSRGRSSCARR